MAKTTANLQLYEKESTDGKDTFNITTMLNNNWEDIDADSKTKADDIASIKTDIGTATLQTTDKTLKGAVNEVKNSIPTIPVALPANGGNSLTVNGHTAALTANTSEKIDIIGMVNEVKSEIDTGSNAQAGTYKSVTVNSKGQVTAGTNPTTLSDYGITDAVNSNDVVATATANKILKLDSNAKLPSSITGDAATLSNKSRAEFENDLSTHSTDYTKHIPYLGTTTNESNVYSVDSPEGFTLTDGQPFRIKFNSVSTGAVSLKIGSNDAIPIYDFYGNPVTNVRQYGLVTLLTEIHGSTKSFTLDGKGGDGTATAPDILEGKTATTKNGLITGDMPNNGSISGTITTQNGSIIVPNGFTTGGSITANFANLIASNIKDQVNIGGIVGNLTVSSLGGTYSHIDSFNVTQGQTITIPLDFTPSAVIVVVTFGYGTYYSCRWENYYSTYAIYSTSSLLYNTYVSALNTNSFDFHSDYTVSCRYIAVK